MSKDHKDHYKDNFTAKILMHISKEFITNPDESAQSFVSKLDKFLKDLTKEEREYFIDFCHLCGGKMSCKVNWE